MRASHGTGIGFSSTAAFWIPGKPPEPVPAPQKPRALGRPPKLPDAARRNARKRDGNLPGDRGGREERGLAGKRARDSDEESEPPEVSWAPFKHDLLTGLLCPAGGGSV